ncbi:hypothetical protein BKA62DRAFT_773759 [Auriculariales sp. MPI-PUGE-AT-0066]|nr:hypothetical protein BKA62DRAFT_773759 [Auriculariales sp. MPI-PUGE-AT-0066]
MLPRAVSLPLFIVISRAVDHTVSVGSTDQASQQFAPKWLDDVLVGDTVHFNFTTAGHAVSQTSLESPCVFLNGGFSTGKNVPAGGFLTIEITDVSAPIFYADSTGTHCKDGAAGAINGGKFQEELFANIQTGPSDGFDHVPDLGSAIGSGKLARITRSSSLASGTSSSLGAATIVGVVFVALLLVIGIAFVIRHWLVVVRRRRAQKRTEWKRRLEGRLQEGQSSTGGIPHVSGAEMHADASVTRERRDNRNSKDLDVELPPL